ncbi:MAG: ribonuclease HII [Candidatus Riflebacteria bacterium]|nr:ribonuclease HII [Candidatus Riflebacteria bacterium]
MLFSGLMDQSRDRAVAAGSPAEMTAAAVKHALSELALPEGFLEACLSDRRSAVRQAAAVFQRAQERKLKEQRRLESLYSRELEAARRRGVLVGGVDEVGRGPLAGPVVAACVVLPPQPRIVGLDDSKALTPAERDDLDRRIRAVALGIGVGMVDATEIDRINILNATLQAMTAAVSRCAPNAPGHLLLDAVRLRDLAIGQEPIVGGDRKCACIAAASIVAKVARDRLMVELDRQFPGYGFAAHKGYGTPFHLSQLARLGPSAIHRRSFAPVHDIDPAAQARRFLTALAQASSLEELRAVGERFAGRAKLLQPRLVAGLRRSYARRRAQLANRSGGSR